MHTIIDNKGFTLIEAIIYIALFTFITGGAILSAYQIFDGSERIRMTAERETEINFMIRKLDWALRGSKILSPGAGSSGDVLLIEKLTGGDQYTLGVNSDQFVISTGAPSVTYVITNNFVDVTNVTFARTNGTPEVLSATFTVDGETIGPISYYVRQD